MMYDEILKGLLALNTEQLAEVKARAGVLLQAGGNKARTSLPGGAKFEPSPIDDESDIELVLSEIAGHLREQGVEYASIPMLKAVTNYRSFADKVPATMIYFRKVTSNRVKLRALIRVSIGLLYKQLSKEGLSATTRTMMSHWHRIPAVINSNFPGYARGGYLAALLNEPWADTKYVNQDAAKKGKT